LVLPLLFWTLKYLENNCILFLNEHIQAIIFLIVIYILGPIYWHPFFHNSKTYSKKHSIIPYLIEKPIDNKNEDLFNRNRLAYVISSKIRAFSTIDKTFNIAITGKWGSGKTSFINLLERNLEHDKRNIIVYFNPWTVYTNKSIIEQLLSEILNQIKSIDSISTINKSIQEYFDTIATDSESVITKSLKFILSRKDTNTINDLKNKISKSLLKENKVLIILIDDMDRLGSDEIKTLLKLIRNTTDFKNTIYISGFDENYINEAIKSINPYKHTTYLDKIFQLKFNLPNKKYNTNIYFKSNLINSLIGQSKKDDDIDKVMAHIQNYFIEKDVWFSSIMNYRSILNSVDLEIRDINKIINSFSTIFTVINNDLHFGTLLNLEVIKVKYPILYNLLRTKRSLVLQLRSSDTSLTVIAGVSRKTTEVAKEEILSILKRDLSEDTANKYISLIETLVYVDSEFEFNFNNSLNYDRYFHLDYLDRQIKYSDFKKIINLEKADLLEKLKSLHKERRYSDFEFKLLNNIDEIRDEDHYLILFESIISLNIYSFQDEFFYQIYSKDIIYNFFNLSNFEFIENESHDIFKDNLVKIIRHKDLVLLLKLLHEDESFVIMSRSKGNLLIDEILNEYWNDKDNKLNPFRYFLYVARTRLEDNYNSLVKNLFSESPYAITYLSIYLIDVDMLFRIGENSAIRIIFDDLQDYIDELNKIKGADPIAEEIKTFISKYIEKSQNPNEGIKFEFKELPIKNRKILISELS